MKNGFEKYQGALLKMRTAARRANAATGDRDLREAATRLDTIACAAIGATHEIQASGSRAEANPGAPENVADRAQARYRAAEIWITAATDLLKAAQQEREHAASTAVHAGEWPTEPNNPYDHGANRRRDADTEIATLSRALERAEREREDATAQERAERKQAQEETR